MNQIEKEINFGKTYRVTLLSMYTHSSGHKECCFAVKDDSEKWIFATLRPNWELSIESMIVGQEYLIELIRVIANDPRYIYREKDGTIHMYKYNGAYLSKMVQVDDLDKYIQPNHSSPLSDKPIIE